MKNPGIYVYRLKQIDTDGTAEYSPEVKVDLSDIIKMYEMMQNYPNPFNPTTKIAFKIPEKSNVKLVVYDIIGNNVATLVNKQLEPGYYEELFNGSNLSSGVYIYRIDAIPENGGKQYHKTNKMMLVK